MSGKFQSPYWNPERDEFSDRRDEILFWHEVAMPLVRRWKAEGGITALDAGCGTGRLVEALYTAGWFPRGITYQPKEVEAFNVRCPRIAGLLDVGDIHELPYPDASFDLVVCWDVLEHTLAPLHVLGELRRVTKPDGHLLAFLPGEHWIDCDYHIIVPNIRQMVHLLMLSQWHVTEFYDGSEVQDQSAVYVAVNDQPPPLPYSVPYRTIHRATSAATSTP